MVLYRGREEQTDYLTKFSYITVKNKNKKEGGRNALIIINLNIDGFVVIPI
jgi:hypothetical protein